jgi:REP element-mobilizing transposase RayT
MAVMGYHVVFTTYGFWLPNDPRGSGSDYVGSKSLREFGPATKVKTRRSVAAVAHDRRLRLAAKKALRHPEVRLTGRQALSVAKGFRSVIVRAGCEVHACTVLPGHVHLVIGKLRYPVERFVNLLKGGATRQLIADGLHPFMDRAEMSEVPTIWGRGLRKVFLNSEQEVRQRIKYVENNPLKEGKPRQRWSFVVPFQPQNSPPVSPQARRAALITPEKARTFGPAAKQ